MASLAESEAVSEADQTYVFSDINWVTAGRVAAVRNQGQCGSCWAFATASAVESAIAIKGKKAASYLSTQQLVDCNTGTGNNGCNGGWYNAALDYIKGVGLTTDTAYPYKAKAATCALASTAVRSKIISYNQCSRGGSSGCTDSKIHTWLKAGPVAAVIDAYPIMDYGSGLFIPTGVDLCT